MIITDKYGFPRLSRSDDKISRGRAKRVNGFATGDTVKLTGGRYAGETGRFVARVKGPYITQTGRKGRLSCSYTSSGLFSVLMGGSTANKSCP